MSEELEGDPPTQYTPEELERMVAADDRGRAETGAAEEAAPVRTVNWRTLTAAEAPAVWAALREWVGWLIHRYELSSSQIPDCWFMHGAIVEELSALYGYWQLSFHQDGSGGGPIAFHDRLLPTLKRFPDYGITACAGGEHFVKSARHFHNYKEETPAWEQTTHTYGPAGPLPAEFAPLIRS